MTADATMHWLDQPAAGGPDAVVRWYARAALRERIETRWPQAAMPGRVRALMRRLEAADGACCRQLRAAIRAGHGPALFARWCPGRPAPGGGPSGEDYDALDDLVAGLLRPTDPQAALRPLEAEMVGYQPTPARHLLEMLRATALGPGDVLMDLGAGLGQVPMLAALCTGARAVGIEWQPAYVASARRSARTLGLDRAVRFLARDARDADLGGATVFFLYTPFRGALLRRVLDRLRAEAGRRAFRVCTFGPCTPTVAAEAWLRASGPLAVDRVGRFDAGPGASGTRVGDGR